MPRPKKYFTEKERLEAKKASTKRSYHANIDRVRAQKRAWYRRNKERLRPLWNLRDKRKRNAEGSFTPNDVERISVKQRGKCAICAASLGTAFHRDHIIPLVLGGSNWPSNIQLLCAPCNIGKGAKDPIEHMRSLGRLL